MVPCFSNYHSAIGKHIKNDHGLETIGNLTNNFSFLKKRNGKLDCLICEMFFIKKMRPCLNTQSHSIRAKLFNCLFFYIHILRFYMHMLRFITSYGTC